MGRRVQNGTVGGPILGNASVSLNTITTQNTNEDLILDPEGNGEVLVHTVIGTLNDGEIRFYDGATKSSNYVGLRSPGTVSSNRTYVLPNGGESNGYALITDGSGNLSWSNIAVGVQDNTTDSGTYYPLVVNTTSGSITQVNTSSTKLTFVPSSGTLTATALVESSSIALKENFSPIDNALDKVKKLQGWIYDRKDGSYKNEAGLVAEEVEPIIPNVVSKDENGNPTGINYSRLTAYLIESVKTLSDELEKLKEIKR